jgi:hypothetical protein
VTPYFDGSRDPYEELLTRLLGDLVRQLEPSNLRDRLSDRARFAVAVENTYEPNAKSFAQGDAWLALMDRSMIQALYGCARAVAGRVNRPPDQPACESCNYPSCLTPSNAITARRWFESGWRATRVPRQPVELWMPHGEGLAYANMLAVHAELFVLAHEIGHHRAGHTEGRALADHLEKQRPDDEPREFVPTWLMELEADMLGAQLVATAAVNAASGQQRAEGRTMDGAGVLQAALGAEHFMTCAELWQRAAGAPQATRTHPPIEQRRLAIRSFWLNAPGLDAVERFVEDQRGLFAAFWSTLLTPNEHDTRAWQAERVALTVEVQHAFTEVAARNPDHLATVAPKLDTLRGESSQLLFDSIVREEARGRSSRAPAAAVVYEIFCDTPKGCRRAGRCHRAVPGPLGNDRHRWPVRINRHGPIAGRQRLADRPASSTPVRPPPNRANARSVSPRTQAAVDLASLCGNP